MITVRDRHTRGHTDMGWLDGDELREGDSAKIEGEGRIELDTDRRAEILLFDL